MLGHWYDVVCDWCGSRLRVAGPRPCQDEDPRPITALGRCPACDYPQARWRVPSFDYEIQSPEQLQQLIEQGQQDAFDFGSPDQLAAIHRSNTR
jgi:hypothetical protein